MGAVSETYYGYLCFIICDDYSDYNGSQIYFLNVTIIYIENEYTLNFYSNINVSVSFLNLYI